MKKTLLYLLFIFVFASCSNDDITDLNNKYDILLQGQVRQAEALKNHEVLLAALQNKVTVDKIETTATGYKIVFSDKSSVQIANKHTPLFSLAENGNWQIDGKDTGIEADIKVEPKFEIIDGLWHINGESTRVKADGVDGGTTPSIINIVIQNDVAVFTFSNQSQIKVPMLGSESYDFSKGFFIINEGMFGKGGIVNFYNSATNKVETNVFGKLNASKELGNTTQFATIYNERMYLISKQGALVVADAKTLKEIARIDNFNDVAADGSAFCGVNANLGLVSTSKGIYKLNLNPLSVEEKLVGISGSAGELLQYRNYVFALVAKKIHAINTSTWEVEKTFNAGKSGLTVSKDGMIWSTDDNLLIKINPYTLEMETIAMPNGTKATYNQWAWTQGSLTASKQENALFFVSNMNVFKYTIGDINSLNTPLFTVPSGRMIYGTGLNVDPKTNQVLITTIVDYGQDAAKNNLYFYDGTTGSLKKNIFYEEIWFPSMIVFPEN